MCVCVCEGERDREKEKGTVCREIERDRACKDS